MNTTNDLMEQNNLKKRELSYLISEISLHYVMESYRILILKKLINSLKRIEERWEI